GALALVLEALAPAAILHLALTVPEPRPPVTRSGRSLVWLYAPGLAAGLAQLWMFRHAYAGLLFLNRAVFLAIAAASLVGMASVAVAAVRGGTPLARRRARVVLTGAIVAFLAPVLGLLAFFLFGRSVSFNLLTLSGFLFPLSIGYAIARHDLFEADRFVKQALVYAVITALVSLAYAGALLVADGLAAGFVSSRSAVFPIAFVLVALGLAVFEARGGVLSRDEAEESARLWRHRDALRALFDALGATLLVPLLRQGRPAGLLAVGGKASGRPFSADDMDVLGTLANQTAIALANAAALEELREAQENLARAERLAAVGQLSAAVAHSIRNPLAGIRLAAQLALEQTAPDSPVHENLQDVLE